MSEQRPGWIVFRWQNLYTHNYVLPRVTTTDTTNDSRPSFPTGCSTNSASTAMNQVATTWCVDSSRSEEDTKKLSIHRVTSSSVIESQLPVDSSSINSFPTHPALNSPPNLPHLNSPTAIDHKSATHVTNEKTLRRMEAWSSGAVAARLAKIEEARLNKIEEEDLYNKLVYEVADEDFADL